MLARDGNQSGSVSGQCAPNPRSRQRGSVTSEAPGSSRQNQIQTQLLARGGNRGGSAVAHGNRSHVAGARSDGVGDFGLHLPPGCLKPEGVPAETDTIEGHNIPRKGPYAGSLLIYV